MRKTILIVLLAVSSSTWADDNYDAQRVSQDDKEAVKSLRLAAEQGDATAQLQLGIDYYLGHSISQDSKEAVKWYRLAAKQGVAKAQNLLGMSYNSGDGVFQDYVRGYMWHSLAAISGLKDAGKYRDAVSEQMTPQEITKAKNMAKECLENNYKGCD